MIMVDCFLLFWLDNAFACLIALSRCKGFDVRSYRYLLVGYRSLLYYRRIVGASPFDLRAVVLHSIDSGQKQAKAAAWQADNMTVRTEPN
jgi:hypothetical protein